jgi:hypothetical protein
MDGTDEAAQTIETVLGPRQFIESPGFVSCAKIGNVNSHIDKTIAKRFMADPSSSDCLLWSLV